MPATSFECEKCLFIKPGFDFGTLKIKTFVNKVKTVNECRDSWCIECRKALHKKETHVGDLKKVDKDTLKCYGECKLILPVTDFYVERSHRRGYSAKCKKCRNAYMKRFYDSRPGLANRHARQTRENRKALEENRPAEHID